MHRRWVPVAVLALALAACSPSASDSASPSEEAPSASQPAAAAAGTITLPDDGAAVDGPGVSITEALETAGAEPLLVNGILLQDVEGDLWLCEALSAEAPRVCDGTYLAVENYPADAPDLDPENADVTGLQEEDGAVWLEDHQLYGVVEPS